MRSKLKRNGALAMPLLALGLLAGCGGGNDNATTSGSGSAPSGAASTLKLAADPSGKLSFDKRRLQANSGNVTIVMKNPAPLSHNVSIEGPGVNEMGKTVGRVERRR